MTTAELLISQAPHISHYADVAKQYWHVSRHPDNLSEVKLAAQADTAERENDSNTVKALHRLGSGVALYQFLPTNEIGLGVVADTSISLTDSIPVGVGAVATSTLIGEAIAGSYAANMMDRYPKATKIVRERYFSAEDTAATEELDDKKLDIKRIAGVVAITGTGSAGATLDHGLRDNNELGRAQRSKKVARVAAGMLFVINAVYASVLLGAAKGAEVAGADNAVDSVTDVVGNPVFMIPIIGSLLFGKKIISQQAELFKHKYLRSNKSVQSCAKNRLDQVDVDDLTIRKAS